MADHEHNVYGDFCNEHPLVGGTCLVTGATMMVMVLADLGKAAGKALVALLRKHKN